MAVDGRHRATCDRHEEHVTTVIDPTAAGQEDRRATAESKASALVRAWVGRGGSPAALLDRVGGVDQVGILERVDALKKRSIKKASKVWALDLTIRMIDLTHARGQGHRGQGTRAMRQGDPPRAGTPARTT